MSRIKQASAFTGILHTSLVRITLIALALPVITWAGPTAGLWQQPERSLWVQVNADKSTYFCTYSRDSIAHPSRGALLGEDAIEWRNGMGRIAVEFRGSSLVLRAGNQSLELKPATDKLPLDCAPKPATLAGIWQYPGRAWWLQIEDNGSTFACRLGGGKRRTLYGRIDDKGRITWEGSGATEVKLVDEALQVSDAESGGTYLPAAAELPDICFTR